MVKNNSLHSKVLTFPQRQISIITGASSGLGKEFSLQLTQKFLGGNIASNQELWLFARTKENLESLKIELEELVNNHNSKFKIIVKIFAIDLSGTQGVKNFENVLFKEAKNGEFRINFLINNAGFGTYGPFVETPLDKELEMIDLNCTTLTGICGLSIKYMSKNSSIINVASLASFMPLGNFAVYAASKAYVLSFTVALAAELKHMGIKVSALCPGSVSTNFANVASNGARKEVLHGKSPKKVVAHCLKKAGKNKKIILWWPKWKLTAFMSRFVGRYLVAWGTFKFNKRPYQK